MCFVDSGGFGNKVFQNITIEWTICSPQCLCVVFFAVLVFCCCVSLLSAFICQNVSQNCALLTEVGCFVWLTWIDYFCKGLLSFNRVFSVLLTPGGFGNKVFQNITVEWNLFSPRCSCVVFRRSCILLLRFLVFGVNLSKCVAKSCF